MDFQIGVDQDLDIWTVVEDKACNSDYPTFYLVDCIDGGKVHLKKIFDPYPKSPGLEGYHCKQKLLNMADEFFSFFEIVGSLNDHDVSYYVEETERSFKGN